MVDGISSSNVNFQEFKDDSKAEAQKLAEGVAEAASTIESETIKISSEEMNDIYESSEELQGGIDAMANSIFGVSFDKLTDEQLEIFGQELEEAINNLGNEYDTTLEEAKERTLAEDLDSDLLVKIADYVNGDIDHAAAEDLTAQSLLLDCQPLSEDETIAILAELGLTDSEGNVIDRDYLESEDCPYKFEKLYDENGNEAGGYFYNEETKEFLKVVRDENGDGDNIYVVHTTAEREYDEETKTWSTPEGTSGSFATTEIYKFDDGIKEQGTDDKPCEITPSVSEPDDDDDEPCVTPPVVDDPDVPDTPPADDTPDTPPVDDEPEPDPTPVDPEPDPTPVDPEPDEPEPLPPVDPDLPDTELGDEVDPVNPGDDDGDTPPVVDDPDVPDTPPADDTPDTPPVDDDITNPPADDAGCDENPFGDDIVLEDKPDTGDTPSISPDSDTPADDSPANDSPADDSPADDSPADAADTADDKTCDDNADGDEWKDEDRPE